MYCGTKQCLMCNERFNITVEKKNHVTLLVTRLRCRRPLAFPSARQFALLIFWSFSSKSCEALSPHAIVNLITRVLIFPCSLFLHRDNNDGEDVVEPFACHFADKWSSNYTWSSMAQDDESATVGVGILVHARESPVPGATSYTWIHSSWETALLGSNRGRRRLPEP
jgi:hypothetical protein